MTLRPDLPSEPRTALRPAGRPPWVAGGGSPGRSRPGPRRDRRRLVNVRAFRGRPARVIRTGSASQP